MAHAPTAQRTSMWPFTPGSMSMTQISLDTGPVLSLSCPVYFRNVDQIAFSEYMRRISNISSKELIVWV
jgi:hypothetical protein